MPPLTHRVSPLRPLFPILMAGAIAGIICITDALSLSALLFSGILAPYVGIASTLALLTTLIGGIIVSLWSSRPGSILTVQDVPTVMLTLTIGTSLKRLYVETNAAPELLMVLTTTIAMIALCTLLNGGMLYALGHFKLGNLMRYIPYPVVGGFLAGTGWLLCVGAMLMMTGLDDATQWRAWVQPDALMQWVPGVLFAIVLFQVLNRFTYFWLAPMVMFGAIALFYIILALFGISLDVARSHGLVFAFFSPQTTETSLTLASFTHIRWSLIVRHIGDLIAISVMSILSFLFNLSGIETTTPQEFDLNRELRVTGTANLASGLSGGMIGFHGVGVTALSG
ncbi:MAG: SulP family inorganic anion transporter, partial [Cyanobacteria bacterium J06638_28]